MRAVIGSDHQIVLAGLPALLGQTAEIVGRVEDWQSLLRIAEEAKPDLVIVDVEHSSFGWIRSFERIHRYSPQTTLVCVSANGDKDFLEEMSAAGAITKAIAHEDPEELRSFLRSLTGRKTERTVTPIRAATAAICYLSPREKEILRLVAGGAKSQEIAKEIGLSVRTVEFHRANIMRKTRTRTVADLTRYAIRTGALLEQQR